MSHNLDAATARYILLTSGPCIRFTGEGDPLLLALYLTSVRDVLLRPVIDGVTWGDLADKLGIGLVSSFV